MTKVYGHGRPRKFWKLLSDWQRQALRDIARPVQYANGVRICTEGDDSEFALVIEVGAVKVFQRRSGRRQELVAVRTVDDIVGEGIWSEDRRNATLVALHDVRALRIEADEFGIFLRDFPEVDLALRRAARDRAEESVHRLLDPRNTTSRRQLARLMIQQIDSIGIEIQNGSEGYAVDLGLSPAEVGQLIGFSERTVQRAFATWREQGLVSTDDRRVIIHDEAGLRRVAFGPAGEE
ncbi:MAG TPA: Crp/Fnr family transcriptional regulator [Streptosporangiaceae bacterium]